MPKNPPDAENEITSEASILSFIIRVWREESTSKKRVAVWRGHITPIFGGKRQYFTNIKKIPELIMAHLKAHKGAH